MLQRVESVGSQLATRSLASGTTAALELAAGSVMRLPHGDVAAALRPTGSNGTPRRATYELLVANDTPAPLATFTYAVAAPGSRSPITWNAIVVPPFSAIAIEIDIAIPRRCRMPHVVTELVGEQAQLTVDAPPERNARAFPRSFTLGAAALALVAIGAGSIAQSRPRVLALAAPPAVRAGTPFSVAYAFAGAVGGQYVVETPDGLQVRRGSLPDGAGAFTVALPTTVHSSGYDVRVWARGRFGSDERTTHVVIVAGRAARAATPRREVPRALRLGALALERDVVRGGESIVVAYRASDDRGIVRLIDGLGTVRAEALLTPRGRSILAAPHVDTDQDFRIVATAERGTARDEESVPVTILHAVKPTAPPPVLRTPAPAVAVVAVAKTAAPIAVAREQVAGRGIVVRIDRYEKNLHVALLGASSEEIVGSDVAPGESSVVLTPSGVSARARYDVVATYTTGFGQETLVRPITFRAP